MNIGEVWQVDYPYEDDPTQSKPRPCVIIDSDDDTLEVLIIKVTHHKQRDKYDIPIFKWKEANLDEPSFARVSKFIPVKKDDLIKRYGELDMFDFKNISKAFKEFIEENT